MSGGAPGITLQEATTAAALTLRQAGIEDAAGDARRLAAAALGGDGLVLIREPARVLSGEEAALLSLWVARRAAHEPVSRILGWREFYGRRFEISPDVLDPRPDTETVVETALDICGREGWRAAPIRILDLGTGSGCILLTLLAELPEATGVGLDISAAALEVARGNAVRLGVAGRCSFEHATMLGRGCAGFDLVVSNPPYISSGDLAGLDPDVARYDPVAALDGGSDGLLFYRDVLTQAALVGEHARRPHWTVLEAGIGQAAQIADFAREIGAARSDADVVMRRDLNGVARCVAVKTRE